MAVRRPTENLFGRTDPPTDQETTHIELREAEQSARSYAIVINPYR